MVCIRPPLGACVNICENVGDGEEPLRNKTHNQLWQFVVSVQIADIGDWYTANVDRFLPGTEEASMWEGKYYGADFVTGSGRAVILDVADGCDAATVMHVCADGVR